MNLFKRNSQIGLALILFLFLASCSSDDDKKSTDPNFGHVSFTISGDVEGEKTGIASFSHFKFQSIESWDLDFNDYSPASFDLTLSLTSLNGVSQPEPGDYEIGFEINSSTVFDAIYTNVPNGKFANAVEYDTMDSSGTLTIEISNNDVVSGSFEFTAHSRDDETFEVTGTVNVKGTFSAVNSDNLQ